MNNDPGFEFHSELSNKDQTAFRLTKISEKVPLCIFYKILIVLNELDSYFFLFDNKKVFPSLSFSVSITESSLYS